jgi:hypothetical protein
MRQPVIILSIICILIAAGLAVAAQEKPLADYTEMPEVWTCGSVGPKVATCYPSTDADIVGEHLVVMNFTSWHEHYFVFPKFRNARWDLSKADALEIRIKPQVGTSWRGANPVLYLRDRDGRMMRVRTADDRSLLDGKDGEWTTIRFPLHEEEGWEIFGWMGGSLEHVDWFEVSVRGGTGPDAAAHHVLIDGVRFLPEQMPYEPPDEHLPDLDVLWIERDPKYERYNLPPYQESKIDPNVTLGFCVNKDAKHCPDVGETVTWTAHIENKARARIGSADLQMRGGRYEWILDGKVVATGDIPKLKRRERYDVQYEWPWDPADHDLTFRIIPDGEDLCDANNELTIRTNALIIKHMIERGAVAQMELKLNMLGSRSAEDYLQGQIRYMNQIMAASKYSFAPDGIAQRVMIGIIEYVDDYECVELGWGPYRVGELDLRADGGRGVTALPNPWGSGAGMWEFHACSGRPDGAWIHELGHQIGLIDDYQLITEPGDNLVNGVGFNYEHRGIMGGGEITPYRNPGEDLYGYYSPSNVQGLNATKGKRRGYFGEYLYQIPTNNTLIILDEKGAPVANAGIKLYQTGWITTGDGGKKGRVIDHVPEHQGRTDARGYFRLKNRPADHHVTETGCEQHDNPFGPVNVVGLNCVMLIIVEKDGVERYGFITVPDLNFAYAAGNTEYAEYPITVKVKGDEKWYYAPPLPDRFYGNKTGLYADRNSE